MAFSFESGIRLFTLIRNACRVHFSRIVCRKNQREESMRITLMHNPKAGDAEHGRKQLIAALAKAGHQATYQSTKKSGYIKALKKPTDLVLAAGGDGTVVKVGRRLIDTGIPLSVLPLGTANNLARSLGFAASAEEIIASLNGGRTRVFDVGIARGPWGKRYIFEGAGAGLLADYVQSAKKEKKKNNKSKTILKEHEMLRHVSLLRQMLRDYTARKWNIHIDGKDISGRYILWEAMNIRSVGPALYLAPWAETKDGEFDFLCVREDDRPALTHHLDARLAGEKSKFPLSTQRFRKLKIVWEKSLFHFDDKLWPKQKQEPERPSEIEITVKPSALLILQPPISLSV
jgi:diacylglycerol kinase (ATP)